MSSLPFTGAPPLPTPRFFPFITVTPSGFRQVTGTAGMSSAAPGAATLTVGVANAAAAGNTLIGVVKGSGGESVSGVTDTQGNTWVIDEATTGGGPGIALARSVLAHPLGTSDTITATFSASSNSRTIIICEYFGSYTPDVLFGRFSGTEVTATTATAGSETSQAAELAVAGVGTGGSSDQAQSFAITAGTPATMTLRAQGPASEDFAAQADGLATTRLTPSASWSWENPASPAVIVVSYIQG